MTNRDQRALVLPDPLQTMRFLPPTPHCLRPGKTAPTGGEAPVSEKTMA